VLQAWHQTQLRGEVLDYLADLVNSGKIDPVGTGYKQIFKIRQLFMLFVMLAERKESGDVIESTEAEVLKKLSLAGFANNILLILYQNRRAPKAFSLSKRPA
jgi:hypothetical protein